MTAEMTTPSATACFPGADMARDHRGHPRAEAEDDPEPEKDERHVEGERRERRERRGAHLPDEIHVRKHVDRLHRHTDHDRERETPERSPRMGDEFIEPRAALFLGHQDSWMKKQH